MGTVQDQAREAAHRLRDSVAKLEVGSIRVRDASLRFDENALGEVAAFLDLTLSDPRSGADTWPLDEVLDLHRQVDLQAERAGLTPPWHVTLRRESPEEPEEEASEGADV